MDGVLVDIRYYGKKRGGALRLNNGEWERQFSGLSLSDLKANAIRRVDKFLTVECQTI